MASAEKVFARRASGLVRGLSLTDAFGVALMNVGLLPSMWFMISVGLLLYPRGNLVIAALLGFLIGGVSFPLVWGILGGSMPRSGGEYVYNSRILGPFIAVAESFGNAVAWVLWITTLAPYAVDPGLTMLFDFMGMPQVSEVLRGFWGLFLVSSLVNIIGFLLLAFGMKIFAKAQKIGMAIALAGTLVLLVVLSSVSHEGFVTAWNNLALQYNSLDYTAFVEGARVFMAENGAELSSSWTWGDTIGLMVAGSWLIIYCYAIAFIGGEVKRPDKTLISASFLSCLVCTVAMVWAGLALYNVMGVEFTTAASYMDGWGEPLAGYNLPWSTHLFGLAAVITQNKLILGIISLSFLIYSIWFVALSYMAFPRILFAWGMDRVGPKWFTDLNPRTSTPIKTMVLLFVIGELSLLLYCLWPAFSQGLAVTGLEIVSVFAVTALAATLFAHRNKVKNVWDASPYKNWKILGIPLVTLAGILNLIYLALLAYGFLFTDLEGLKISSLVLYVVVWIIGIVWYLYWKSRGKKSGLDVEMAFDELPPD